MLPSCFIAFSMYSKIPVPQTDWSEKNMRYVMCFLPLVGAAVALAQYLLFWILAHLPAGPVFRASLLAVLPILITGGIHMDGLMDTCDARGSWGDQEKKLAILKDSHTGAFAILGCGLYLLLWAGAWSEVTDTVICSAVWCFVFSRILSGLAVTVFRCARDSGLAATFQGASHRQTVRNVLLAELALCAAGMLLCSPLFGGVMLAAGGLCMVWYRVFSYREFGGITGDLAGYFLTICELAQILAVVLAYWITVGFSHGMAG